LTGYQRSWWGRILSGGGNQKIIKSCFKTRNRNIDRNFGHNPKLIYDIITHKECLTGRKPTGVYKGFKTHRQFEREKKFLNCQSNKRGFSLWKKD
jgi:hypothetical protein